MEKKSVDVDDGWAIVEYSFTRVLIVIPSYNYIFINVVTKINTHIMLSAAFDTV